MGVTYSTIPLEQKPNAKAESQRGDAAAGVLYPTHEPVLAGLPLDATYCAAVVGIKAWAADSAIQNMFAQLENELKRQHL